MSKQNEKGIIHSIGYYSSFSLRFCFLVNFSNQHKKTTMKKVTGIGGVFFKCKDPKKITEWYEKYLGLNTNPYGATFE